MLDSLIRKFKSYRYRFPIEINISWRVPIVKKSSESISQFFIAFEDDV